MNQESRITLFFYQKTAFYSGLVYLTDLLIDKFINWTMGILFFIFGGFFDKCNIDKDNCDYSQKESNLSLIKLRCKINHNSFLKSSACIERYIETIAPRKFNVNVKESRVANALIIHAAAILEKIEENTLSWESVRLTEKNILRLLEPARAPIQSRII